MKAFLKLLPASSFILLVLVLTLLGSRYTYAQDRTLLWDADTSNDKIAGYYLYYGTQSRYPSDPDPYKGTEAAEGPSPIPIPNKDTKEYTLIGLNGTKVYFFAVKSYDSNNRFSFFSNEEMTFGIRYPGGGFYVNDEPGSPNYSTPYTIRGRADKDVVVNLIATQNSTQTPLGSTTADANRDWFKDVDFSQFSDGPIVLRVQSGGISPPDVTATYDTSDPTSQATSATDSEGFVTVPWWADDATSGVGSTVLWCKGPVTDKWVSTGLSRGATGPAFYYIPDEGTGTYYFATRSVDKAGNWEEEPTGDGDTWVYYTAPAGSPGSWPDGHSGLEGGGGGCFIDTAATD